MEEDTGNVRTKPTVKQIKQDELTHNGAEVFAKPFSHVSSALVAARDYVQQVHLCANRQMLNRIVCWHQRARVRIRQLNARQVNQTMADTPASFARTEPSRSHRRQSWPLDC